MALYGVAVIATVAHVVRLPQAERESDRTRRLLFRVLLLGVSLSLTIAVAARL